MLELTPHNMSKRQRRKLMIKEVNMSDEIRAYINQNNTYVKMYFNRLSALMLHGKEKFDTGLLNQIVSDMEKEIKEYRYSKLTFWQKCLTFLTK